MNKSIKIIFMGTPVFGEIVLEKLINEFSVVLVVTQPDKRGKRGNSLTFSPVKELALKHNIPIFQPESIKEDNELIMNISCDFIVTAAYGQFIPNKILKHPLYKTLNVHGSLLPKYRGGAPIQRAIMDGDKVLGVSIMETVLKMDSGNIYTQNEVLLNDDDTTSSMMEKLALIGSNSLVTVINNIVSDNIESIPQDEALATYSPNIEKSEEIIDFNKDATIIHNQIRALYDNPIARFNHNSVIYKVYRSKVIENDNDIEAGTIISNDKELIIKCGVNAISILKIQSPGKNVLDIEDFLNGKRKEFKLMDRV